VGSRNHCVPGKVAPVEVERRLCSAWMFGRCGAVWLLVLVVAATASAPPREEASVEELKARVASSNVGDRPHLCVQIAEKQLDAVDKLYASPDVDAEKAQAALTDVVAYSELARDYAIQSHKYQKQSEIAVRGMSRKLTNLLHGLSHEEQGPLRDAVNKLERVRDDLLSSMFKKGEK
jgi:hypothetical protein